MSKRLLFILLLFPAIAGCHRDSGRSSGMLQIKGSDTMLNLVQAWAERYMEINETEFLAVTGGGSGTGIAGLIAGTCDIAMTSRSVKKKESELAERRGVTPAEIKVAIDGLAVVVNPVNPVSRLTMDQLAGIYTGKIPNWKDVGGSDETIVILSREVNSGTHVYFKEHVLQRGDPKNREEYSPKTLLLSSSQAIADEVAGNTGAIGYYGMGYVTPAQKPVSIAEDDRTPFEEPTVGNVVKGIYPISRPLFFYTHGTPQGKVKKFLDFALSKEGQKIVVENDFVPVVQ